VIFTVDGQAQPAVTLAGDGTASWSTTTLPVGTRKVVAGYSGDTMFAPSDSDPVTVQVIAAGGGGTTAPPTGGSTAPSGGTSNGLPPPTPPSGPTPPQHPPLASTGSPIGQLTIWASVLLVVGAAFILLATRRRRGSRQRG